MDVIYNALYITFTLKPQSVSKGYCMKRNITPLKPPSKAETKLLKHEVIKPNGNTRVAKKVLC